MSGFLLGLLVMGLGVLVVLKGMSQVTGAIEGVWAASDKPPAVTEPSSSQPPTFRDLSEDEVAPQWGPVRLVGHGSASPPAASQSVDWILETSPSDVPQATWAGRPWAGGQWITDDQTVCSSFKIEHSFLVGGQGDRFITVDSHGMATSINGGPLRVYVLKKETVPEGK